MPQASDRSFATPMIRPRLPAINGATPAPNALREISFILWLVSHFTGIAACEPTSNVPHLPSRKGGRSRSADDLPAAVRLPACSAAHGGVLVADRVGEFPAIGAVVALEGAGGRDAYDAAARRGGPGHDLPDQRAVHR